ncbi:helix-turn-helix domain-containing protein [Candidatus Enterococcus mangumiae]|uniref:HTH cro/C1-type domain-containing protein n=1 Tax=Candidatus Enterococcus mangumiae TaxID=2230878 RepID=A0ABZ2SYE2_9ENTE|nr:helix-turn-helix transcriptional regulator [Enterococcus sp. DIV1094]MBO0490626.1 helix-turn-helix transcriptional regulator [Enterococcus sp. DIV1094]
MEFGKILKEKRKQLGITQEDLAKKLNVSRSAISNWEIGRNYPDIHTLVEISALLAVSLDELLENTDAIEEAVESELKQKRRLKKMVVGISTCFAIFLAMGILYFVTNQPKIEWAQAKTTTSGEVVLFNKKDIKEINLSDKKLSIVFDLPDENHYAGYYVDGSEQLGEVNLDIYKMQNSEISKHGVDHDGLVEIDLSNFTRVKKVNINHAQ